MKKGVDSRNFCVFCSRIYKKSPDSSTKCRFLLESAKKYEFLEPSLDFVLESHIKSVNSRTLGKLGNTKICLTVGSANGTLCKHLLGEMVELA